MSDTGEKNESSETVLQLFTYILKKPMISVRMDVLYNVFVESVVPMNIVRLLKCV
jgi:hypothetical protein